MSNEETQNIQDEIRSYELAFHIVPTVSDSDVERAFATVKTIVTKHGGAIKAESVPTMIPLAYVMEKTIDAKKRKYNTAYFGWVIFEAAPEALAEMKPEFDLSAEVLRYLLVKTDGEAKLSSAEVAQMLTSTEEGEVAEESAEKPAESAQPVEAEKAIEGAQKEADKVDQAIEELVKDEKAAA